MIIRFFSTIIVFFSLTTLALANVTNISENAKVEYKDKRYYVDYTIQIKSSSELIISALTNYIDLKKIIPSITKSLILEKHDDHELVETHFSSCVLLFCKKAINTQRISHNNKTIKAVTIPDQSDFRYGLMTWEVLNIDHKTYVKYHAVVEPKFWVPPFIGPAILKHKLRKEAQVVSRLMANL